MNQLFDGLVLEFALETELRRFQRILWIDETGTDAVVIELFNPKAQVRLEKCVRLIEALADGDACPVDDPYGYLKAPDSSFNQKQLEDRNRNVQAMSVLIHAEPEIRFDTHQRGARITEITNRIKTQDGVVYRSRPQAYLLWRRYCQRGQINNALISDRHKSGWTREQRDKATEQGTAKKIGRGGHGVNLTPQTRDWLVQGAKLFWEHPAKNKRKRTWVESHQLTLERFFLSGYRKDSGVRVPILPPADELPTVRQMKLAYFESMNVAKALLTRHGNRRFRLKHRAVHGNQTQMVYGPMELVQFDINIGDVYLVDSRTRETIDRPTIGLLRCTFTRLICGFAATWEHASWIVAGLSIENMALDKVEYCASLGIPIQLEWWPCQHLPQKMLADCGELLTKNSSQLVNGLRIRIKNTASGRADQKGVIESGFDDLNDRLIHHLPGAVLPHMKERDYVGPQPAEMARLDIHEFRALMVDYILDYNRRRFIENYPLADDMLGQVNPIPCELWAWAVENRQGHLRKERMDIVRLNTLSSGSANVTHHGVHFENAYYNGDIARREEWAVKARIQGSWKVNILYDPRDLSVIYLRRDQKELLAGESVIESMERIDADQNASVLDIGERRHEKGIKRNRKRRAASDGPQQQAEYNAQIASRVKKAEKTTERALGDRKKQNVSDLRSRHETAITQERQTETVPITPKLTNAERETSTNASTRTPEAVAPEFTDDDFVVARRVARRGAKD